MNVLYNVSVTKEKHSAVADKNLRLKLAFVFLASDKGSTPHETTTGTKPYKKGD